MLSRVLFAVAVAGSMLLTGVPAREASCKPDSTDTKPCPRYQRCTTSMDCQTLRCNLTCELNDDPTGRATRVCR